MSGGEASEASVRPVTEDMVLIEAGGRRLLAEAHCPHRGGLLRFGHVDGTVMKVRCPLHHSVFDLKDGSVSAGPSCRPLRIISDLSGEPVEQ